MMVIVLKKSDRKGKRLEARINNKKSIHFGLKGGKTFIDHQDNKLKDAWLKRHKVRENWKKTGIETAGFWSRWILWNRPTLNSSIKALERRFNVKLKSELQI